MNWIKVSDQLPAQYDRVFVFKLDVGLMCYGAAVFLNGKFLFDATLVADQMSDAYFGKLSDKVIRDVTHWQLLERPELQELLKEKEVVK